MLQFVAMNQDSTDEELKKIMAKKAKQLTEEATSFAESNNLICDTCKTEFKDPTDLVMLKEGLKTCAACMAVFAQTFINQKSFILQIAANGKFAEVIEIDPITGTKSERQIIPLKKLRIIAIQGTINFYKMVDGTTPTGKITINRTAKDEN